MEVAFVGMRTDPPFAAEATARLRRTAEGLAARGHDVTVLCARWWGFDGTVWEDGGVTYRAVCDRATAGTFAARLPVHLTRVNPDVVHAAVSPPAAVASARVVTTALRVPLIVDWWADHPADRPEAYRRIARLPATVTVPSRLAAIDAREHGVAKERVTVAPEPLNYRRVRAAPVSKRADVVYARRLDADANVESLLLALAELRDLSWRAAVVGDGPARPAAEKAAADLRIGDRVEFLGDLPLADLLPVLRGAHVFAQTATSERFASELCWALACGCVGVVEYQADSAAHELIEGDRSGVSVTSPQELADEIATAAERDRRLVNDSFAEFDRPAVLRRLEDCYRAAAEGRGLR
jgi:glycosyltransferase involved in cell wall biosynthesis